MPAPIRTDNGAPFAGTGSLGRSKLSLSWTRMGIVPASLYQRSSIMFPRVLTPFTYPRGFQTGRVNTSGDISSHKDRVFISQVFSFEDLGFEEMAEEIFRVYFREIEVGGLDVTELRFRPVTALP